MDLKKLKTAFKEAEKRIGYKLNKDITFDEQAEDGFTVVKSNGKKVVSAKEFHNYFIGSVCADFLKGETLTKKSVFSRYGIMIDVARNGVPTVEGLKTFIVRMAFCGYSYLGLYLEDCLEVDNEEYFGYMRGRYTKAEIKEIVDFADMFGIEVVPYIQTLAHLYTIFRHYTQYTAVINDYGDILLVDEPRTYELIENVIKTCSEVFKSGYINIGMDEAKMMLLGKYRIEHGICDRGEVFSRHIKKVCDICDKYHLKPSAWADMFENHIGDDKLVLPDNLTLNVWSYYGNSVKDYSDKIDKARSFTDKISFAGGVHKYYGYAPLLEFTDATLFPSIQASENRVNDYCITLWGDDGSECSYNAVWYSLISASIRIYDLDSSFSEALAESITGYSMVELKDMNLPNKVFDNVATKPVNVSKYTFFEDLFMGISDRRSSEKFRSYFKKNSVRLKELAYKKGCFNYIYKEYYLLTEILSLKSGLRDDIIGAYKRNDKEKLNKICDTIKEIREKLKDFTKSVYKGWLTDYKPFGMEIEHIRLGGLKERLKYIEHTLKDYVAGKTDSIYELTEVDLAPTLSGDNYEDAMCYNSYEQNVTFGNISHKLFN